MRAAAEFKALPVPARLAIAGFGVTGILIVLPALLFEPLSNPLRLLCLLTLAAGTANAKVRLYKDSSLSLLTSVVLLALLVGGRHDALLAAVCGVSIQLYWPSRKLAPHRLAFNTGMIAMTVRASSWTYSWFVSHAGSELPGVLAGILGAASIYYLGNSLGVSLMVGLAKRDSILRIWYNHFLYTAPSFLIAGLLSMLAFELLKEPSGAVLLALMPVVGIGYYSSLRLVSASVRAS